MAQLKSFDYGLFAQVGFIQSNGDYTFSGKHILSSHIGVNIISSEIFSNFKIISGLGLSYFQGNNETEFVIDLDQIYDVSTSSKERYLFLSVPLLIQYHLKKFSFILGPKLSYLLLEDYKFDYELNPFTNDLQIFYPNETRSFYLGSEVGIIYDFGKVGLSLSYNYFLSSLYKSELVDSKLYGLNFGLLYKL